MSEASSRGLGALAVVLLVLFLLRGFLLGDGVFARRDVSMVYLPQAASIAASLQEGEIPLWDPNSGFGRSLVADPRAGIFYPPTWALAVVPPATVYTLSVAGHLLLAGLGVAVLARCLGLSPAAGAAAAGLWVASGPLLSLATMWHHLAAAAWMPWALLAGVSLARRPRPRGAVGLALAFTAQAYAGSPDMSLLTAAALLPVLPACAGAGSRRRVAGWCAVAAVLAALLAAPLVLPTASVVSRAAGRSGADSGVWSLHPLMLPEIALPIRWADVPLSPPQLHEVLEDREPWLTSVYCGLVGVVLAGAGLASGRGRGWGILVGLSLLAALGRHTPAFAGALALLPPLGHLRFPVKALLPGSLALALLAGWGLDACRDGQKGARRAAALGIAVVGAATLLALAQARGFWHPRLLGTGVPAVAPAPLALGLAWLVGIGAFVIAPRRVPVALAALVAIADPACRHQDLHVASPAALLAYRPPLLDVLGRPSTARIYAPDASMTPPASPLDGTRPPPGESPFQLARAPAGWTRGDALVLGLFASLHPPTAARWGVPGSFDPDVLGFDPAAVADVVALLRAVETQPVVHTRLLAVGGVTHVVAVVPAPWWEGLQPVGSDPGLFARPVQAFRVPGGLPRAWAVDGVRVEASRTAALRALLDLDPAREVLLAEGAPHPPGPDPPGVVEVEALSANALTVQATLRRPGFVVVADAWDPGWVAEVDGTPAPVQRANVAFRAVACPAGAHRICLRYAPLALRWGAGAAALGALLAGGLLRLHPREGSP